MDKETCSAEIARPRGGYRAGFQINFDLHCVAVLSATLPLFFEESRRPIFSTDLRARRLDLGGIGGG
ncbi:hypothetical protein [Paraburkholderia aromaticivorans]|uniref:hypothetical protein n=1 Tax=Paraburkholderia aromaticivorans TaxID=2026199 RepID=UPI0014560A27|nr:hypothetical protein [Paraburkholderia aromaticivorans]